MNRRIDRSSNSPDNIHDNHISSENIHHTHATERQTSTIREKGNERVSSSGGGGA
jgi:hypothetical protein